MKLFNKIRDFTDTSVAMVILLDNIEQLGVMAEVLPSIELDRCSYEFYERKYEVNKNEITAYMIELRLPYNRYLDMMQRLHRSGWTLKPETKVDIFNRLIKMDQG